MHSLGARRDGVHLGGVDEVDAARCGKIKLRMGFGFVVLFAEGHRAEGERRNPQIAIA
jgi:hypothetical protein